MTKHFKADATSTGWDMDNGFNVGATITDGLAPAVGKRIVVHVDVHSIATLLSYAIRYNPDDLVASIRRFNEPHRSLGRTEPEREVASKMRLIADLITNGEPE